MNIHTQTLKLFAIASQNFIPYQNTFYGKRGLQLKEVGQNDVIVTAAQLNNEMMVDDCPLSKVISKSDLTQNKNKKIARTPFITNPTITKRKRCRSRSSLLTKHIQSKTTVKQKLILKKTTKRLTQFWNESREDQCNVSDDENEVCFN